MQRKEPIRLSIAGLIAATTITSTLASLSGGLILYFQSLESLRESVSETSLKDVEGLKAAILPAIHEAEYVQQKMKTFFEYEEIVTTKNDGGNLNPNWVNISKDTYDAWEVQTRWWTFAAVNASKSLEDSGLILLPHDVNDPSFFYHHHWYDLKADGSREYVHATMGYNGSTTIKVRQVDSSTGYHTGEILYESGLQAYKKVIEEFPNLTGWSKFSSASRHGFYRFREPLPWYASDNNPYVYMAAEAMFVPPPPPHPWSQYRAVIYQGMFVFDNWEAIISNHHVGTTIVLLDVQKEYIYSSSEGQELFSRDCVELARQGALSKLSSCYTTIRNASKTVQDAWNKVRFERSIFTSSGSNFVRRADVFSFTASEPDSEGNYITTFDGAMLWIKPHSSVQRKVTEALTLLFIFVCLVFTFDVTLALLEMKLVALPVSRASKAVIEIGRMDLEQAMRIIKDDMNATVQIAEVSHLISGLLKALENLTEFRTFIPDGVLETENSNMIPPEGTVAIAFTDIEGSTQLWEELAETMVVALSVHNSVMRRYLRIHNGYEVKTMGDAFMVAFSTSKDAINWAIDVQENLLTEEWPVGLDSLLRTSQVATDDGKVIWNGLRVRMGVHFGEVTLEMNPITNRADYRGGTINKASRIENVASPGMIACSTEIIKELGQQYPATVTSLGTFELKGIGKERVNYICSEKLQPRASEYGPRVGPLKRDSWGECSSAGSIAASRRYAESNTVTTNHSTARKLTEVNGVVATIDMISFKDQSLHASDMQARALSTVQGICDVIHATDGRVQGIIGSHVTAGWNISQSCSTPLMQSFRFSGTITGRFEVHCGIGQGKLLQGNIGTARRRYHTIIGRVVEDSVAMVKMAKEIGCAALAAITGGCVDQLSDCSKPINVLRHDPEGYVIVECLHSDACANIRISWEMDSTEGYCVYRDLFMRTLNDPSRFTELISYQPGLDTCLGKHLKALENRGFLIPIEFPQQYDKSSMIDNIDGVQNF